MDSYKQVSLDVSRSSAGLVTRTLEENGAISVTVMPADDEQQFDAAGPGEPAWENQRFRAIFQGDADTERLGKQLEWITGGASRIEFDDLEDQDWERTWLKDFRPVEITHDLWVCPSWCDPPDPEAVNLIMDPGLAFGTGTHETTVLCLEYLASTDLGNRDLLDFGCGSGILAIAALLLGVDRATGVDIDPRALKASVDNAVVNRVDGSLQVLPVREFLSNPGEHRFDIVVANILAETLIESSEVLKTSVARGGEMLLSGILESQVRDVSDAFGPDWKFEQRQQGQWVLLVGKNTQNG